MPRLADRADRRLEHHVELARIGQRAVAAIRAGQVRLAQDLRHLLWRHALGMDAELLLDQMVGPESALAGLAVDQRIVEVDDVTRRLPDAWVHQDAGIEADHVAPPVDEGPPPELLDVVLQLNAERSVIPGVGQTAVDIGAGKNESASLGERDDLVH